MNTSQAQRNERGKHDDANRAQLSLVFEHIPIPEYGDPRVSIYNGHRREPAEGPGCDSHFYDALVKEGVSAMGCGHDHVNDFCARLPPPQPRTEEEQQQEPQQDSDDETFQSGLWSCYGGGSGSRGYCTYGAQEFHRRARVWELDTGNGKLEDVEAGGVCGGQSW
ncbi:hypothetical protein F4778DRAFT_386954 [Xylariomycetidae sp. FL2044]|nr:hypothetical protein F4778DRAFT_386954 [Xylariomycetidae sp. FL2044]